MKDILSQVTDLRRPTLLITAARLGVEEYRREIHLRRVFGLGNLPRHGAALVRLLEVEAELEDQRSRGDAAYPVVQHVETMIAIMGEARLLRSTRAEDGAAIHGQDRAQDVASQIK